MGAAQRKMDQIETFESVLQGSKRGDRIIIDSKQSSTLASATQGLHAGATRSSLISVDFLRGGIINSSGKPPGHQRKTHNRNPDLPRNNSNNGGDTTTRSPPDDDTAHHDDTPEDGHRMAIAGSNGLRKRDLATLATTAERGRRFSDSESDGEDNESDDEDYESGGAESECDGDEGERRGNVEGRSVSGDEGGYGGGAGGGSKSREKDGDVNCSCKGDFPVDSRESGAFLTSRSFATTMVSSQEAEGDSDSDSSWSRWNWSSSSSASSGSSDYGGSFHTLSFSSLGSHSKRRWKSRRSSLSVKNGRRSFQLERVEASVQAGDGALLSERELVEEQTVANMRVRLRANILELSRERFRQEVMRQEEAQTRQQLTSQYEAEIEKLKKKVQDQDIFREKMLDKLAECEDDEMESDGRGAGQTKDDNARAELEALQRSNAYLITELQDLRQKYQAQSATLRQEREALADARKALEAK